MIDKLLLPKAYVEVLEILKYIPQEDYIKIPPAIIENMQQNKDKLYKYEVTNFDDFQNQKMLKETKTILAVLFRDYWATQYQKEKIETKERYDLEKMEEEKRKKYNPDNIFNPNTTPKIIENTPVPQEQALVEVKQGFFARFISRVKEIFHVK